MKYSAVDLRRVFTAARAYESTDADWLFERPPYAINFVAFGEHLKTLSLNGQDVFVSTATPLRAILQLSGITHEHTIWLSEAASAKMQRLIAALVAMGETKSESAGCTIS